MSTACSGRSTTRAYDTQLDDEWVRFLDRWYSPLRFPVHGLQMLAAYVAQMAPSSRITNCASFQMGDEMRRVQRIAYRTVQLAGPPFDDEAVARQRAAWEEAAAFQPLRELIERALVAYDWGESFIVTNAVIKPRIDRLVNQDIAGTLATANGDPILTSIHFSLDEDAHWHREWTAALIRHIVDDNTANAEVVSGWIEKWSPLASEALEAFAERHRGGGGAIRPQRGGRPHHRRGCRVSWARCWSADGVSRTNRATNVGHAARKRWPLDLTTSSLQRGENALDGVDLLLLGAGDRPRHRDRQRILTFLDFGLRHADCALVVRNHLCQEQPACVGALGLS